MGFSEKFLERFQPGILLVIGKLRAAEGLLMRNLGWHRHHSRKHRQSAGQQFSHSKTSFVFLDLKGRQHAAARGRMAWIGTGESFPRDGDYGMSIGFDFTIGGRRRQWGTGYFHRNKVTYPVIFPTSSEIKSKPPRDHRSPQTTARCPELHCFQ